MIAIGAEVQKTAGICSLQLAQRWIVPYNEPSRVRQYAK
jgi:hypothetical protein